MKRLEIDFKALAVCAVLAMAFVFVTSALAQTHEGWQWNSPLGLEPDSPPVIEVVDGSDSHVTFMVTIPGFWFRNSSSPGGYVELDFPGLGQTLRRGAPNLPVVGFDLAVPTTAEVVDIADLQFGEAYRYEMVVYPRTIPERDHEEGDPEVFFIDENIYGGQGEFPSVPFRPAPIERNGPIPFARAEIMPCSWSPADNILSFHPEFRVTFEFPGNPAPYEPTTLEMDRIAASIFENWGHVLELFPPNTTNFDADYLFVYPEEMRPELLPLINQKKARGYLVSEITVESTSGTCAGIRSAIQGWYTSIPFWRAHYCLLVGDTDRIPLCDSPALEWKPEETAPTDDLYASTVGDDLFEEIYLGRLSIDDAEDLARQVDKILQYEDHASPLVNYRECGLVAHKENAPDKYEGAHESVRMASYSRPPTFRTFYGSAGATDGDVNDFIDSGVGIVAYRGHGSAQSWTGWNTDGNYYGASDIDLLGNGTRTPVIWSFACNNAELGFEDCVGEYWLERIDGGAVAHYGATIPSYTSQNHELDRAMFRAVWDYGVVTHSHAIQWAEYEMAVTKGSDNAWMYLLLGDPDMKIKRNSPPGWTLVLPEVLPVCHSGVCDLRVRVFDATGAPMDQVLVSAWKGSAPGAKAGDEVFTNGYTDGGSVVLPISPSSEGTVDVVVRDLDGNVFVYSIPVVDDVSGVSFAGPEPLKLTAAPSISGGNTTFRLTHPLASSVRVELYDVRGQRVRTLDLDASVTSVLWDGRNSGGRRVPSGVYYARVTWDDMTTTTRVTMVR